MTGLVFLLVFLFRLTLVDRGLMYWWDERMHWFSLRMWADVASGNWADFVKTPFNPKIQGRPLWIILNMIPAGLQGIYFWFTGVKTETPQSLHLVGIYNVILSMIVLRLFWLVTKRLFTNRISVLVAILVYGLLVNSTINVRHMYPIYSSLILYLTSLWLLLRHDVLKVKAVLVAGILAGMGQLTYASYFLFPIFELVVIVYRKARVGSFALGYAIPLLAFALWARSIGTSIYASISRDPGLNPTLIEALLFLPVYLIEAEGLIGITLLVSAGLLVTLGLIKIWKRRSISLAVVLGITSLIAYIAFALTTIWHHRIYARVIHIYILFLIVGIVGAIEYVRQQKQYWVFLLLGIVSIYSFYRWARVFSTVNYPLDVKFRICDTYYRCPDTVVEIDENNTKLPMIGPDIRFILVNTPNMFPKTRVARIYVPPNNFRLVLSSAHPLNFIPYQLEGYNPQERNWLRQYGYAVRVYQKIGEP